jgi:hypothetical protein
MHAAASCRDHARRSICKICVVTVIGGGGFRSAAIGGFRGGAISRGDFRGVGIAGPGFRGPVRVAGFGGGFRRGWGGWGWGLPLAGVGLGLGYYG